MPTSGAGGGNEPQPLRITISDAQNMIPSYDGNSDELHRFITCSESLLQAGRNDADKSLFFDIIKTKLTGVAYDILKYKIISSWNELKAELTAQFQEERPRSNIQAELMRVKQGYKESVKDFSQRVAKLLGELNNLTLSEPTEQPTKTYLLAENEKNAIKAFEDGLYNDHLKILAKASKENSLRKLIAYILEHSYRVNEHTPAQRQPPPIVQNIPEICSLCSKPGHKQENCFSRKKLPQFSQVPIKRELNRVFCSYCHRPNHHIRDCRTRIRNEETRNRQENTNRTTPFRHVRWSSGNQSENDILREEEQGPSSRFVQTQAQVHPNSEN